MRFKILALGLSFMACVAMLGAVQPPPQREEGKPFAKRKKDEPKKKKGAEEGPAGDLRKAYDLLRKLRSENQAAGRPEARIRDWTERASRFYREGVRVFEAGDRQAAHEYGAMAHELARAVDHARNASLFDRPDDDLPPPPEGFRGDRRDVVERDLREAYDRLRDTKDSPAPQADSRFYADAASDVYRAAVRDAQQGRLERAGELARAAVAMTHVIEHMGHLADRPEPPRRDPGRRTRPALPDPDKDARDLPLPRID